MTLRRRVALAASAAVAVAIVLASFIVYAVVRENLRGNVDEDLRELAADVADSSGPIRVRRAGIAPDGTPVVRDIEINVPPQLGQTPGYAQLVTADGGIVRPRGRELPLPAGNAEQEVAVGARSSFYSDAKVDGTPARVFTSRIGAGQAIQAVLPLDDVEETLSDLRVILFLVSLGGVALAAGLGLAVTRTALRPVADLTDAAEHVSETRDLTRRIETAGAGGDELGRLAGSFNAMLGALEGAERAQRQLVADASHELRTPLTSLRTNVELLARSDAMSQEDRQRLLSDVTTQLEELTVLVGDLVDLARGAEPDAVRDTMRLDLLAGEAIERARVHHRDVAFDLDAEPCEAEGDPARVHRAIANLLDNAAKHGAAGGRVQVTVRDGEVVVRDHGPGFAEEDLPYAFDRFYRAPSARRMPGSGLGLAIVRQVAEAHGGSVQAENAEGGGARLRLRLSRNS